MHGKRTQGVEGYDKFSFLNISSQDTETIIKAFKSGSQHSVVNLAK